VAARIKAYQSKYQQKNMWTIRTRYLLVLIQTLLFSAIFGQGSLNFFTAKSEITIQKNGEKEEFTAHIRYNLKDTLWISFTGSFGIEGARMLVTKDSTYIINKIEKTSLAFFSEEENYLIPYAFSLQDWNLLLLNQPLISDSNTEFIMENDVKISSHYSDHHIKKMYQKNNRLLKCHFNNTRSGKLCEVMYSNYTADSKSWAIAKERNVKIIQSTEDEPITISIRYLDFAFNSPRPFNFNFSKYKNDGL
jgi:hypothetical protein